MNDNTAQPDPQHCDHEEICRFFFHDSKVAHRDGTSCMRNHEGCAKCTYDTRPLPPSPASTPEPGCYATCPFDDLCANDVEKIQEIEKRAADAATLAENKRVLDEIIGLIHRTHEGENCYYGCNCFHSIAFEKEIESLRRHAPQQEERR